MSKSKVIKEITDKHLYEIASDVQVGKGYLSDVLNGKRQPSLKLCIALQKVTQIHYLYFLLPQREANLFLIKI